MNEPASVTAYRQLIANSVDEFVIASRSLGEPLTAMAYMVKRSFQLEVEFIAKGVRIAQPDDEAFAKLTETLSASLQALEEFRQQNRNMEAFVNHISTICESIVALSWISVRSTPAQFVRDMKDAGDYYGNRVLLANKGNKHHANWIAKWNDVLKQLEQYVKDFHPTGFSWKSASNAGTSGVPPPPPPPPPEPLQIGDYNRSALLNQLNQGVGITRMLRPVLRQDQATGASPPHGVELKRDQATGASPPHGVEIQATNASAPQAASKTARFSDAAVERVYPPKFFLDGKKWRVEHIKDNYSQSIETDNMSESIAMFKCVNSGLTAKNKMNAVTIDNCKHVSVVLNDIISSVEVIRCERLRIQCTGYVPLVSLDSCDSVQIFLTDKSQDVEIIQSKTTSCNVCIMKSDGDYIELPLPEQIRTVVVDRKLKSSVVEKQ